MTELERDRFTEGEMPGGGTAPLTGQTAIVTGAGRGLGRGYALRLAVLGADVAVIDLDLNSYRSYDSEAAAMTAENTVAEVKALGRRALGFDLDVGDSDAVEAAVREISEHWGRLDIAICNAGGGGTSMSGTNATIVTPELVDVTLRSNLVGTVNTCRAVAPVMKSRRYGRIVTVASQAGCAATRDGSYAHYGAAKAGVIMYTRYLAQELGPFGINVNCLAPGYIETGRLAPMFDAIGRDVVLADIALRRIGTVEDCARIVEFLVTELSDYVTGALIPVDGGSVL
jgi:3-oxoacyl-[acyl-carrier protein] reductase